MKSKYIGKDGTLIIKTVKKYQICEFHNKNCERQLTFESIYFCDVHGDTDREGCPYRD